MRAACVLVILACASSVRADAPPSPWAVNVTAAQKANAKRFLDAGNARFVDRDYTGALDQYRAALAEWDHPAIRFNLVRCLVQLGRAPEAAQNLELALAHGAAPFEEGIYTEALGYQKLLANSLGELVIECKQPGVKVTLNGKPLPACPTREQRRVEVGTYEIVGSRSGLLTRTIEVVVAGGARREVAVQLDTLDAAARIEHRWATWKPWVVFGSGVAIAAVGSAFALSASADKASFDRTIAQHCSVMTCSAERVKELGVDSLDDSARRKGAIAVGVVALGAAAVATGAVMLYLNRGRRVYEAKQRVAPRLEVAPDLFAVGVATAF